MNPPRLSILSLAIVSMASLAAPARAVTIYATVYGGTSAFGRFDSATGAFTAIPTTGLPAFSNL